ncbi:MAG: bifunctional 5,10-methylenetetrahydrofolate dehydrogenase/5,10-methenyltetrahydrofolate cyclohydrolase, partial [Elusimicrobia bacterium]|nr:bifunctional 5,10-methylenetetrahydrofolate dehydrogenase/5,10-methenyltetrahydrofolate cyclohydrolase [Elusimicrobiota bacterium]
DEASVQYRDLILRDAARVGVEARALESRDEEGLLRRIDEANQDPGVHGLVVLYPLRSTLHDEEVMDRVSPYKDAEGLHSVNLGYLIKFRRFLDEAKGIKCVVPATPKAVVKALQRHPELPIERAFAVIVNNSMRVGKPLGLMLENLGATVVKCYDKTRPEALEACVRRADIVVTAVPDPRFRLDPSWIKAGAAVVDVSHQGNVDARSLEGRAALATVPENRVGRITRAMMFVNLIYCARYKGIYYP